MTGAKVNNVINTEQRRRAALGRNRPSAVPPRPVKGITPQVRAQLLADYIPKKGA